MKLTGNTILITGGGSGIGRALAESLLALGNQVIITGRREQALRETAASLSGVQYLTLDVQDASAIKRFADQVSRMYPKLNFLINNAGIMQPEDLLAADFNLSAAEATIATNLLGPIRLTAALLPLLRGQPQAAIAMVSSGLAFVPMAATPTYSATKAAIHSYSQSLRHQLRATSVRVVEIIPPYVQTELMGAHQATDPNAMPLKEFISEIIEILQQTPMPDEVCVRRVNPLRFAQRDGKFQDVFGHINAQ